MIKVANTFSPNAERINYDSIYNNHSAILKVFKYQFKEEPNYLVTVARKVDGKLLIKFLEENGFVKVFSDLTLRIMELTNDGFSLNEFYVNYNDKIVIQLFFGNLGELNGSFSDSILDDSKVLENDLLEDTPSEKVNINSFEEVYNSIRNNVETTILTFSKQSYESGFISKLYQQFPFKNGDRLNKIYILKKNQFSEYILVPFRVSVDNIFIDINYGKNFTKVHEKIISNLKNDKSGLYIFFGPPGTGKTSYLKYLTTEINRKFVFVPNWLIGDLFSPENTEELFLLKDSVIILEDSEICMLKRDGANNNIVSTLLNISDGFLKDNLNITLIVTFNTFEYKDIDPALLRPGRLKYIHKFDLIDPESANKLAEKLGKDVKFDRPVSLAEVFNNGNDIGLDETVNSYSNKKVGFLA